MDYDPATGALTWRTSTQGHRAGNIVGCVNGSGYRNVWVDDARYPAHRLIWLHVHGRWPTHVIDHRNGARDDNRLCNLREATHAENCQNAASGKKLKSRLVGASPSSRKAHPWQSTITLDGKKQRLGVFATEEEAHAAYLKAKAEKHAFQPAPRAAA
jgi:hypothetical protein